MHENLRNGEYDLIKNKNNILNDQNLIIDRFKQNSDNRIGDQN